jgi:hypothetical protein
VHAAAVSRAAHKMLARAPPPVRQAPLRCRSASMISTSRFEAPPPGFRSRLMPGLRSGLRLCKSSAAVAAACPAEDIPFSACAMCA